MRACSRVVQSFARLGGVPIVGLGGKFVGVHASLVNHPTPAVKRFASIGESEEMLLFLEVKGICVVGS